MKRRSEDKYQTSPIKRAKSEKNVGEPIKKRNWDRDEYRPSTSQSRKADDRAGESKKYKSRFDGREDPHRLPARSSKYYSEDTRIHHSSQNKEIRKPFPAEQTNSSDKYTQNVCKEGTGEKVSKGKV